ncbi:cofactor-independent phosphoglycerate mutase [Ruminococcus sp.]|uniref:cofactor-independent phosphoglycerate mutase n=1 Tax=Ruminococcus sp. TaxID=41978 RepID=UPI0025E43ED4|nr:cofactor-independent phosphoglycerate mutase [Ruminococcus sp.]MBD9050324.1 cofactor-independent phosphoglycerate mutase [Ruminococcus sp.]
MKYLVMLCDGMADEPNEALGNSTPMEKANKPCMDSLAAKAEVGIVKTVAEGLKPGSDVANLSVLGYEPAVYYSGRSPLEAASIGIDLKDTDVTLRCNLVTLSDEEDYEKKTILDYCADDISSEEAKILIEYIQEKLGNDKFRFYPGVSYRHCLVWSNGNPHPGVLTPPHDITGKVITDYIPKGEAVDELYDLMKKSYDLLKDHPVNQARIARGKRPANSIWLWGEGTKPLLDNFSEKFGIKGSMISAVDLLKGIAICAGMNSVDVDGATGYLDTNFDGKCKAAIEEFKNGADLVYIHVEAPDECGHRGEIENKVKAIEMIDEHILGPVVEFLRGYDDFAVLVCPDHPTPLSIRTHTSTPVPYLIYDSKNEINSGVKVFCEKEARETGNYIEKGFTMMNYFLTK